MLDSFQAWLSSVSFLSINLLLDNNTLRIYTMASRKDKEIADALNAAMKSNMHAVRTAVLTELINNYFCTPDGDEDEFSDDSSGSEMGATKRNVDDAQVDIEFDDTFPLQRHRWTLSMVMTMSNTSCVTCL
jgi:hypothetical protein